MIGSERVDLRQPRSAVEFAADGSGPENGPDGFVIGRALADADHRAGRVALDGRVGLSPRTGTRRDLRRCVFGRLWLADRLGFSGLLLVGGRL